MIQPFWRYISTSNSRCPSLLIPDQLWHNSLSYKCDQWCCHRTGASRNMSQPQYHLNFDINTLCFEEDIKFFSFEKTLSHFKNIFGVYSLFIEVLMSKLKNPTKCVCISPQFCRLSCCPLRTECECKAAETARRECTATRTLPHCANQNCLKLENSIVKLIRHCRMEISLTYRVEDACQPVSNK